MIECFARLAFCTHHAVVVTFFGRQLNNVAVGITKINGVDELVVRDTASLDARCLAFFEHRVQCIGVDLKRDVQIEIMLRLKFER